MQIVRWLEYIKASQPHKANKHLKPSLVWIFSNKEFFLNENSGTRFQGSFGSANIHCCFKKYVYENKLNQESIIKKERENSPLGLDVNPQNWQPRKFWGKKFICSEKTTTKK